MLFTFLIYLNFVKSSLNFITINEKSAVNNRNNDKMFLNQNCVCVPYWQCKDDFSGLIDDGVDIMDIRVMKHDYGCTGDFDICCQIECGKSKNYETDYNFYYDEMANRILGENNEAEYAEFPWMLGILHGKTYKCGASLIHPQVAITAAHCVQKNQTYKIRAGEWNWLATNEPLVHQNRYTKEIIIHPKYNPKSLINDIALLILESPFKLAENVGVICLPRNRKVNHGERCTASGWGRNSIKKDSYQHVLKKIDLPILKNELCVNILREARLGYYFNLHESFLCAGGEHKKDTCEGDGGSPLICPINGPKNRYEQLGIVSWGLTCGVQDTPGVYVNIAKFNDWIDREMILHNFDINIYRK